MARKSRKNMPVAVAEPTDNLTAKAVLSMDKEAKPYQVGIYARLSFESEANKERDTVDTQIAYIREFINGQDDMVEVCVYADISVTGTTFERPEFDRMIQDIRAGKINTVITRDLSRLGRNYVEAGNYIERVFPFLDVRYIAITDDFDTARPGTDLSVPLKNIVNEYYSTVLSYSRNHGDFSAVSAEMNCHTNTIRYRISKAKALSGQPDIADTEFYRNVSVAIAIDNIKKFFV